MKKIIIILIVMLCFSFTVSAESDDFYKQQFKTSGADKIEENLPDSVKQYFDENNMDPSDYNWINTLNAQNVFKHIWDFVTGGAKQPIKSGAAIIAIILISAAINAADKKGGAAEAAVYVSAVATAAIISVPVFSIITASVNGIKGIATFMLAFIPVFAIIVAASGTPATSVSMSALLLCATEAVSYISGFVVLPLMGGYLALSISSSVSPLIKKSGISECVKKLSIWILSLVSTIFVGILGIQTAVNASADSLTVKTAKFIIGSSIPVAGGALSEALNTVTASMGLLKSSVGIYGVIACCVVLLPLIIELLMWRIVLMLSGSAAELFSLPEISSLLKCIDSMMSVLIGILLLIGAIFVISLTIVVMAGKT